jgi:hypothetical protein
MDAVILRENSSEIMNIMGEVIAEIALRPDRLAPALATARAEGLENLARLDAFVAHTPGLNWVRPQAGLIGLARLPDGIDSDDLRAPPAGPALPDVPAARQRLRPAGPHPPRCGRRRCGAARGRGLPGWRACWRTGTRQAEEPP